MNNKLILGAVLVLGLILRVAFINSSPPSLYGDELTIALDANSILKTGHDQLGNFLPLTFQMGAGRPAGYVYGSVPFIGIFGMTPLGVRSLSILSGLGLILLLYLLGKRIFGEKTGILAAFLLAFSPWDISLSRVGFEAHLALFLAILGVYLFLIAKGKPFLYLFSALCFGLTLHTYPTYKLSLIFFLPLLFWFTSAQKVFFQRNVKYFLGGAVIFIILGFVALTQTLTGGSETRFSSINIFSQPKLQTDIEQKLDYERQTSNLSVTFSKIFHNKPIEYGKVLIENYLQNFSADFLILHGDRNPRQNMATMGEIYLVDAVLILIALLTFWTRQKRTLTFLIFWVLLAPIPTAIIDLPHALRSALMLPPLILLSALGLETVLSRKNKAVVYLLFLVFFIQFGFFIQKLYFLAPNEYSNFWAYPAKLASQTALENKDKYKFVILSDKIDNIEFAYPVYGNLDPNLVIDQNKSRTTLANHEFKKFENVYIGSLPGDEVFKLASALQGNILYITVASDINDFKDKDHRVVQGADQKDALLISKIK